MRTSITYKTIYIIITCKNVNSGDKINLVCYFLKEIFMINKFFKKAFTLAEVLTVLGVVGVIAGITIPTLINNVDDQKNMSMLKKLYSSYTVNIESLLNSEYATNCSSLACLRKWNTAGPHNGALADERFFNVAGICDPNCLTDYFNANTVFPIQGIQRQPLNATLYILPNSAAALVYDLGGNCNKGVPINNENPDFNACSIIMFDTNGSKSPNQPCHDRFAFYLANKFYPGPNDANPYHIPPNFLVPFGYANPNGNGDFDCTAKIISNGWRR